MFYQLCYYFQRELDLIEAQVHTEPGGSYEISNNKTFNINPIIFEHVAR